MPPNASEDTLAVFTTGFSCLSADRFLANLRAYDIQVLVDIRPRPFAGNTPHFNADRFAETARAAGLAYRYQGRELGGLPDDAAFYDAEGRVLYGRVAAQPWFQAGINAVVDDLRHGRRLALACVEEDPRRCHRRLLVGRVLRERGIGVAHILAHGGLLAEAELLDEERAAGCTPMEEKAGDQWRSPRAMRRTLTPMA